MTVWAVIPIKPRAACKSRLSDVLAPDQRLRLVRAMLRRVIAAARAAPGVGQVALLSNERDEAPVGLPLIADRGTDLNSALARALPELRALGATSLVVLPADLPLLTPRDVGVLARIAAAGGVAVAPDWRERGTNALAGPAALPPWFHFGAGSYAAHLAAAEALGVRAQTVRSDGLAFDLDEPEMLHRAWPLFPRRVLPADPVEPLRIP